MTVHVLQNHFVVAPTDPLQLAAVFPDMRRADHQGIEYCAMPATLEHARVLRNLGYAAPSPIRHDYTWPGRFDPRWYQENTSEFLTLNPRAFVLSAMRTGKTLAVLWAVDYLKRKGLISRALVASPLSTLERVWGDHIFQHFYHRSFAVLHGSRKRRHDLLDLDRDFYIVNHHGVEIIEEALQERDDIDLVVIDEVATYRNSQTKKWKSMDRVCNKQTPRWVWGLTGTPTPNAPTDAYGQVKLVMPEKLTTPSGRFKSFTAFKRDTMVQLNQFTWVPARGCEEEVSKLMQPSIRYTRDVCTDMDPVFIERKINLTPAQEKHYQEMKRKAFTEIGGSGITAANSAVLAGKLAQIACGVAYAPDGKVERMDCSTRLTELEEMIEQNNEKVLVFVPFQGANDLVAEHLRKRWSVASIDGRVSKNKRDRIFKDFQDNKDPYIIVAHPETMAHGLELTAASLIIWFAPFNKNEIYNQACARIDGGGQKVKMDIAHLYSTAEERALYTALKNKTSLQDVILELAKNEGW